MMYKYYYVVLSCIYTYACHNNVMNVSHKCPCLPSPGHRTHELHRLPQRRGRVLAEHVDGDQVGHFQGPPGHGRGGALRRGLQAAEEGGGVNM
jgi:hypothetical protein